MREVVVAGKHFSREIEEHCPKQGVLDSVYVANMTSFDLLVEKRVLGCVDSLELRTRWVCEGGCGVEVDELTDFN